MSINYVFSVPVNRPIRPRTSHDTTLPLTSQPPLNDSLSETCMIDLADSSSAEILLPEIPHAHSGPAFAVAGPSRGKETPKCPVCNRSFKLKLKTHISCQLCGLMYHKKNCAKLTKGPHEFPNFICESCKDSPPAPNPTNNLPANNINVPSLFNNIPANNVIPPNPNAAPPATLSLPSTTSHHQVVVAADDVEFLLQEDVILPPPTLPSFHDREAEHNARLHGLSFERSPTQPLTPPDGDCGIHVFLDQVYVYMVIFQFSHFIHIHFYLVSWIVLGYRLCSSRRHPEAETILV